MALALARTADATGLSLFYLETRAADGRPNRLRIDRLKDKLGTRAMPTAELTLEGTPALRVGEPGQGVRTVATMLNITRLYNACCAVATMRRACALARDYASRRIAFGRPLSAHPLHRATLADLDLEWRAGFLLVFELAALLGADEMGEASTQERALLRLLTPVAKLYTAKQAVAVCSEALECFGGAGYIEDTGLPRLLRDAQVLPIWEGTTNVLSLDALRALESAGGLAVIARETGFLLQRVREPDLVKISARVERTLEQAGGWLEQAAQAGQAEAGARRFAMTLGRALSLALLARHAQWSLQHEHDARALAAARRYAAHGVSLLATVDAADSRLLGRDG
jgi:hypothetical protein